MTLSANTIGMFGPPAAIVPDAEPSLFSCTSTAILVPLSVIVPLTCTADAPWMAVLTSLACTATGGAAAVVLTPEPADGVFWLPQAAVPATTAAPSRRAAG